MSLLMDLCKVSKNNQILIVFKMLYITVVYRDSSLCFTQAHVNLHQLRGQCEVIHVNYLDICLVL